MEVVFSRRAKTDLQNIVTHIATDDPKAAQNFGDQIIDALRSLANNPHHARPGRVSGTRELIVHKSYIAAYTVTEHTVTILTVRHAARLWPGSF